MNFLIDAQLPRRLVQRFREAGHDAIHTLDLPEGNRTSDADINALAERDHRIVVTKDVDFVDSFILNRRPPKLLLISTGNITNGELESLISQNLSTITAAFESNDYVEMARTALIVHE
jgi:predicted nuclease of predicted toxin-antitoxin system